MEAKWKSHTTHTSPALLHLDIVSVIDWAISSYYLLSTMPTSSDITLNGFSWNIQASPWASYITDLPLVLDPGIPCPTPRLIFLPWTPRPPQPASTEVVPFPDIWIFAVVRFVMRPDSDLNVANWKQPPAFSDGPTPPSPDRHTSFLLYSASIIGWFIASYAASASAVAFLFSLLFVQFRYPNNGPIGNGLYSVLVYHSLTYVMGQISFHIARLGATLQDETDNLRVFD